MKCRICGDPIAYLDDAFADTDEWVHDPDTGQDHVAEVNDE